MKKIEYKYTVEDVADMVGVKPETVRRWSREKKIKCLKLPGEKGGYRFSYENIKDFIAELNS